MSDENDYVTLTFSTRPGLETRFLPANRRSFLRQLLVERELTIAEAEEDVKV